MPRAHLCSNVCEIIGSQHSYHEYCYTNACDERPASRASNASTVHVCTLISKQVFQTLQRYLAHKKPPTLRPYSRPMPRALRTSNDFTNITAQILATSVRHRLARTSLPHMCAPSSRNKCFKPYKVASLITSIQLPTISRLQVLEVSNAPDIGEHRGPRFRRKDPFFP